MVMSFYYNADANLAGIVGTRKSTTGFVVEQGRGLVSWMSIVQSTVALSTAEAETKGRTKVLKRSRRSCISDSS